MNIKNEIKGHIISAGFTMTDVVARLNESLPLDKQTTVQNLSNKLTRGSIRYDEVKEIARIIGMEIEWSKFAKENKI